MSRPRAVLAASALALSACVLAWARQGDQTGRIGGHLLLFGIAFAAYLATLRAAAALSPRGLRAALLLALAWRLLLAAAPPLLSDDVHRYVWEGRLQNHGGNPFSWQDRPEAEKWTALRDDVWRGVNHKDYAAIYPPLWQLAARAVVASHDSLLAMKLFLVLCEAAALLALAALLRRRGQPAERVLVWAWSPLSLEEVAGSGHNDALGLLLVVLALAGLEAGRRAAAAVFLAGAVQAKLLPGLFAAAWLGRLRARDLALVAAVAAALMLPFLGAGADLWLSLSKYGLYWRFNETLFAPLAALLGHAGAVRAGAALALAGALALAARGVEPARAGLLAVVAFLLLTPNVLPWYALWLLPFLTLVDAPWALLFTGTVQLAYLVYPGFQSGEPWQVAWSVRALEYLPCALAAALCSGRRPR